MPRVQLHESVEFELRDGTVVGVEAGAVLVVAAGTLAKIGLTKLPGERRSFNRAGRLSVVKSGGNPDIPTAGVKYSKPSENHNPFDLSPKLGAQS